MRGLREPLSDRLAKAADVQRSLRHGLAPLGVEAPAGTTREREEVSSALATVSLPPWPCLIVLPGSTCPRHRLPLHDRSAEGLSLTPGLCYACLEPLMCWRWIPRLNALARLPPGSPMPACHCPPCLARDALFRPLQPAPARHRFEKRKRGHRRRRR